jgi:ATP-dependent DNA ligase
MGLAWSGVSSRKPASWRVGFIEPRNLTVQDAERANWIHEITHHAYLFKDAKRVRVFTRRGFNWTDKYPAILKLLRIR